MDILSYINTVNEKGLDMGEAPGVPIREGYTRERG